MISKFVLVSLLSVLAVGAAYSQEDSSGYLVIRSDAEMFLHNAGSYFTAPLHFDTKDWIIAGAVVGGTALLSVADESVRSFSLRNRSSLGDNLAGFGTAFGEGRYALLGSAGCYIAGFAIHNSGIRETGMMLFESVVFAGLTTTVLKSVAGRSRPFLEEGAYTFRGIQFQNEHLSFPSGHATVGFAISSMLAARMKN